MRYIYIVFIFILISSCSQQKKQKEVVLYEQYCASCHIAPDIESLPKNIWEDHVLPAMAARMGIINNENHPYQNLRFNEQSAILKSGIYPYKPTIDPKDWKLLKNYIIKMAPDSLPVNDQNPENTALTQFRATPVSLDSVPGSLFTFLKTDIENNVVLAGATDGTLNSYDFETKKNSILGNFNSAITDARIIGDSIKVTCMGKLNPSEIPVGSLVHRIGNETARLADSLHRPIHTAYADLNENGNEEIVISEFGDLRGKLSLLEKDNYGFYQKRTLLNFPGSIKTVVKDMNGDDLLDLVVMVAQGDEAMYICYQKDDLKFDIKKVLRFSPVFGSSWFELVDYDGDGYDDIITVNGDNADKSYVPKPYHGMRIHLNDGQNNFKEHYFHPLNGATRVLCEDFDKDGDLDMALLATFPDYENHPDYNFVYLDNKDSDSFNFQQQNLTDVKTGRWFLMDVIDADTDGDQDIILSAFSYSFTPVPEDLQKAWNKSSADLLILENKLY